MAEPPSLLCKGVRVCAQVLVQKTSLLLGEEVSFVGPAPRAALRGLQDLRCRGGLLNNTPAWEVFTLRMALCGSYASEMMLRQGIALTAASNISCAWHLKAASAKACHALRVIR